MPWPTKANPKHLSEQLSPSKNVDEIFRHAQAVFNGWSKLPAEERTADRILETLDFDFFELLDSVTIARSRKHIQTFYDTTDIGTFPKRRHPVSIREPRSDLPNVPAFNDIFAQFQVLPLAVYTPVATSFRVEWASTKRCTTSRVATDANIGSPIVNRASRAHDRQPAQTRSESSVEAFRITLQNRSTVDYTLDRLDSRTGSLTDVTSTSRTRPETTTSTTPMWKPSPSATKSRATSDIDVQSWQQTCPTGSNAARTPGGNA